MSDAHTNHEIQLQDMYKRFKRRFESSAADHNAEDGAGWTPNEERKTPSKRIRAHVDEETPATAKKLADTPSTKAAARYFGQHDSQGAGGSSSATMAGSVGAGEAHHSFAQQWNAFQAK